MKWFIGGLLFGIAFAGMFFIAARVQENTPRAIAQGGVPPVTNIQVRSGSILGEVIISWDAVPQATHYRIGYVNMEIDYHLAKAGCTGEWIDAFVYVDTDVRNIPVRNGRAEYTIRHLAPGARHAFTVLTSKNFIDSGDGGSVSGEFFWPSNPRWKFLDGRNTLPSGVALPAGECTSIVSPTPTNGDYDSDDDGLIEVSNLAQLNAMRWDLDGDGSARNSGYARAFPNATPDMGCPSEGCAGYELTANLDFDTNGSGDADAGDVYWNGGDGWFPIGGGGGWFSPGDNDLIFNATFDGNGYTISNLYIYRPTQDHVGLIGALGEHNRVANIGLAAVNVSGAGFVGGLIGFSHNSNVIANSYVTGTVSGDFYVGGLIGMNFITNNRVVDCHSHAIVSGRERSVGGLIGRSGGRISGSYATGDVFGAGADDVGGLVGYNSSDIVASYATGNVFGTYRVGGLAGASATAIITDTYATGNVRGINAGDVLGIEHFGVGGLVGSNLAIVNNSYAIGRVSGDGDKGGLVGHNEGAIAASYFDVQTTGQPAEENGDAGLTTLALQAPTSATGIFAAWNPSWWDFGTSRQYPVLKYGRLDPAAQR